MGSIWDPMEPFRNCEASQRREKLGNMAPQDGFFGILEFSDRYLLGKNAQIFKGENVVSLRECTIPKHSM